VYIIMVRADCPRGYRDVNGICVPLKSRRARSTQYLSLFSNDGGGGGSDDVYVPQDEITGGGDGGDEPQPEPQPMTDDEILRREIDNINIKPPDLDPQMDVDTALALGGVGAGVAGVVSGSILSAGTAATETFDVVGDATMNEIMMTEVRAQQALTEANEAADAAAEAAATEAAEAAEAMEGLEGLEMLEAGTEGVTLLGEAAAASVAADAAATAAAATAAAATAAATAAAAGEISAGAAAAAVAGDVAATAGAVSLGLAGETLGTSLIVGGVVVGVAGATALILENQDEINADLNSVAQGTTKVANQVSKEFDKDTKKIGKALNNINIFN